MWLPFATAACATIATPPAACSCPGQPELCKPLDKPLPSSDVHVYSDCTSPPGAADPDGCDWHKTLNFSAVTTIVQGSKLGGQLVVDNDGSVSWRTKSGPSSGSSSSSLICTAHSHGVRVLPIVDPPPAPHHVPGTLKKPRDYQTLLQNSSAISRAASELATLATAAGFDGVEFDWEGMGAPYVGAHRSKFDYGTAYVSLLRQTRAAVRKAHRYGSTYVTIGLNNVSSKTEKPVFAAYPLKQMADATDGMFIMACEAVHVPSHASVSFWSLLCCSLAISSALTTYTKTTTRKIDGACRMCVRVHEHCVFKDDMNHAHAYCGRANSPLDTVTSNLNGWLALGVPRSKLILGIPWYGHVYHCGLSTVLPGPECATAAPTCIVGSKTKPSLIGGHGTTTLWEVEQLLANSSRNGCFKGWSEAASSPFIDCPSAAAALAPAAAGGAAAAAHTQTW